MRGLKNFYIEKSMRELKKEIWPHKVVLDAHTFEASITEMEIWLGKQLGTFKGRWNVVHVSNQIHFYFKEGLDATMFSLRWQ